MAWRVPSRLIQQRKLKQPPPSAGKIMLKLKNFVTWTDYFLSWFFWRGGECLGMIFLHLDVLLRNDTYG